MCVWREVEGENKRREMKIQTKCIYLYMCLDEYM